MARQLAAGTTAVLTKVPGHPGRPALTRPRRRSDSERMNGTERTTDALPVATCLARLARSRAGYLSCSARALPTVVPVVVRVESAQLLLQLPDAELAQQALGQVVALGVGRPRRAWRRGWSVVARGPLTEVPGDPRVLVMDPQVIEGRYLGRTGDP